MLFIYIETVFLTVTKTVAKITNHNNNIKYHQNGCDCARTSLAPDDVIWLKSGQGPG